MKNSNVPFFLLLHFPSRSDMEAHLRHQCASYSVSSLAPRPKPKGLLSNADVLEYCTLSTKVANLVLQGDPPLLEPGQPLHEARYANLILNRDNGYRLAEDTAPRTRIIPSRDRENIFLNQYGATRNERRPLVQVCLELAPLGAELPLRTNTALQTAPVWPQVRFVQIDCAG